MGVSLGLAEHGPRNVPVDLAPRSGQAPTFCVLESHHGVCGVICTPESVYFYIGNHWRFSRKIRGSETLNL